MHFGEKFISSVGMKIVTENTSLIRLTSNYLIEKQEGRLSSIQKKNKSHVYFNDATSNRFFIYVTSTYISSHSVTS